jgi:hypothetical protein
MVGAGRPSTSLLVTSCASEPSDILFSCALPGHGITDLDVECLIRSWQTRGWSAFADHDCKKDRGWRHEEGGG